MCACGEGTATCACEAFEDERRSACQMSDSACSLNEGDHSAQETWLVQEYCSLGPLQVRQPLHLPLHSHIEPTAALCLCAGHPNTSYSDHGCDRATSSSACYLCAAAPSQAGQGALAGSHAPGAASGCTTTSLSVTGCVAVQLAIAQGKFQKSNGRACCTAILDVACDIAYAMHLLHSQGITHGNLSSSSVLLTPSSVHPSPQNSESNTTPSKRL